MRRAARAAGLVYCTDAGPGILRSGRPGAFRYRFRGGPVKDSRVLARIRELAIPPAWTGVWINPRARGHLQACGRDLRGRKQHIYHPEWRAARDLAKYDNVSAFAAALPRLRRAVRASLRRARLDRERVTAIVVRLLETSLIRVGNEEYARANNSYGLTTLRESHARVRGRRVRFSFLGKGGQRHRVEIANPNLARVVRSLQDLPGQELFCYLDEEGRVHRLKSDDVNTYLREHMGGPFTAKDFRTWAGTVIAALALAQQSRPQTRAETKHALTAAVRVVSGRLRNTPTIARKCYIHPIVFQAFTDGKLPPLPSPDDWPPAAPPARLSGEERAILRLLRSRLRRPAAGSGAPNTRSRLRRSLSAAGRRGGR